MLYVNKVPFAGLMQYKPTSRRLITKFILEFTHLKLFLVKLINSKINKYMITIN